MDKGRLEAFSDNVFSIAMTLLVFNIAVPVLGPAVSNADLWHALGAIAPLIVLFAVSFIVMAVLWINHHFLFHTFARAVDRRLNLLNMLYLMFVAFVPFSSSFIGRYSNHQPSGIIYGINLLCIMALTSMMFNYIVHHPDLRSEELTARIYHQAQFRSRLSMSCYVLGIALTYVYIPASIFFYIFPVIFNIVPGTLDFTERVFRFKLE